MRITPRRDEIKRIAEILESDSYESADKMAAAVLKEAAKILSMRDTYAVVLSKHASFGPFGSKKEAEKAGKVLLGASGEHGVGLARLASPGRLEAQLEGSDWPGYCRCRHSKELHLMNGSARGRCGMYCGCEQYRERK